MREDQNMVESPGGVQRQPPPPAPGTAALVRERPWWGFTDALLAVPFVLVFALVGGLIAAAVSVAMGHPIDAELPVYATLLAVLVQQLAQGAWPVIVSRWKGLGLSADWWWRFDLSRDIGWGFLLAVLCLIGSQLASLAASWAVSLPDDADPSNTQILSDNSGSLWLIGFIFLVTIGAPITEELLFRGVIMQGIRKRAGDAAAVVGSAIIFALPHLIAGATLKETVVLWSGIFTIGVILAIGTLRTGRLGAAVIGHFLFNSFGTIATLVS